MVHLLSQTLGRWIPSVSMEGTQGVYSRPHDANQLWLHAGSNIGISFTEEADPCWASFSCSRHKSALSRCSVMYTACPCNKLRPTSMAHDTSLSVHGPLACAMDKHWDSLHDLTPDPRSYSTPEAMTGRAPGQACDGLRRPCVDGVLVCCGAALDAHGPLRGCLRQASPV